MSTISNQMSLPSGFALRGRAAAAGRYLWHLLQMALSMEVGMTVYHMLLRPILAQTPYAALTNAYPIIGYWGMVVSMALGMFALMVYQRATGRYCLEMTTAMAAPVAALTVLVLCSLIPSHILYAAGDPVMFVAMAAYMLYRPHEHRHGAHPLVSHEHAGSAEAKGHGEGEEAPACH